MANMEQLDLLLKGANHWNTWRKDHRSEEVDLSNSEILNANLRGAYLYDANLKSTIFKRCRLRYADFEGSDCANIRFEDTSLKNANFAWTNLRNANFEGADLEGAIFKESELSGANLSRTNIVLTSFLNVDLSDTRGLDTIEHAAYSYIGIDTLYASKGKIPEKFLLGCGIPESLVTHLPSLVTAEDGIQFHSCFISYSAKDTDFAERLHSKMREIGLRVWFAPEDMKSGQKLIEQIDTAIRLYDKLLIVLSESSLKSEWVTTELRRAFRVGQKENRRKLFPVRLIDMLEIKEWEYFDSDSGVDLAAELRKYFIPDFSNWRDHDSFEISFSRLMKDFRSET